MPDKHFIPELWEKAKQIVLAKNSYDPFAFNLCVEEEYDNLFAVLVKAGLSEMG